MAAKKRSGLGKGLGALLADTESPITTVAEKAEAGVQDISVEKIVPNPHQPRRRFDEAELAELTESIREHGVIQPLIVSLNGDGVYTLIAGERRLRASQRAKLETVPVVVREVSDQQLLAWALIENVQRADLNPLEEAEAYFQLSDEFGLSHAEIAKQVGKSREAVSNTIRLRKLSPHVQEALENKLISGGHARALLGLEKAEEQDSALKQVIALGLNVRQTEQLVKNEKLPVKQDKKEKMVAKSPEVLDIENRLESRFETKAVLRYTPKGGSITLHYASDEDLEVLLEKLL